jgi:hypothetical protein
MRLLDFLFWHYYCYVEQKKTVKDDGAWPAIIMILATTFTIIGSLQGTIETFICDLPLPESRGDLKYKIYYPIGILYILFLRYRYMKQKSIIKNKYQVFRERWGDPKHVSKKNMKILLWYTILSTIGLLIVAAVMGTLNKHGYFEGCRLFP